MVIGLAFLAIVGFVVTILLRLATSQPIFGWVSSTSVLLLILLMQAMMLSFVFCFIILGDRNGTTFLPLRDYPYFIMGTRILFERPPGAIVGAAGEHPRINA
jgi:hypothetical protein